MPLERIFNLTFQLNGWFMRNFFLFRTKTNSCVRLNFLLTKCRLSLNRWGKKIVFVDSLWVFCHLFSHQRFFLLCVIINIWDFDERKKMRRTCEENKNVKRKSKMQKKINWDEHRFWTHQSFFFCSKTSIQFDFNVFTLCSLFFFFYFLLLWRVNNIYQFGENK